MCGYRRMDSRFDEERDQGDRSVRASDADRDRTAEILREQAGSGRLDADELEERLEAALRAKTFADLDALTADLPRPHRREQRREREDGFGLPVSPLVLIVAALVTVSVVAGHPAFWLFFLLLFGHGHPWAGPRHRRRRVASEA